MSHEMTTHITDNLPQIAKEGIPEKVTIEYVIKKKKNQFYMLSPIAEEL